MSERRHSMADTLLAHWPEYLMEAAELGLFMISACLFAVLLEHPSSPVPDVIRDPGLRRLLMGAAMGVTAVAIIYSPIGKQSGAHFNPAVTLTFYRLGKISLWDAVFYIVAQFAGAALGVAFMVPILRETIRHQSVNYVLTLPGKWGIISAFTAEIFISFLMMFTVLTASNLPKLAKFTGIFAGILVTLFIWVEAPVSGMSMNPARSFGSAILPQMWSGLWIYFLAPPIGMLLAAETKRLTAGLPGIFCAKLHHTNGKRCIFCRHQRGEL